MPQAFHPAISGFHRRARWHGPLAFTLAAHLSPLIHRGIVAPVHLWNVTDDLTYAPPAAVDALAALYRNAAVQRHTLAPADVGQRRLGHFGVFRREPGARAWERLLAPIEQAVPALRR